MIFVTVGTQLPFDRLVMAVDGWASTNTEHKVVVQAGISDFSPQHCHSSGYVEPHEWEQLFNDADFIIAHAGMGTILKCLDAGKPLIVMPRKGSLGEHRNDHQIATASKFTDIAGVIVVNDESELLIAIKAIQDGECSTNKSQSVNLDRLIGELRQFANIEA